MDLPHAFSDLNSYIGDSTNFSYLFINLVFTQCQAWLASYCLRHLICTWSTQLPHLSGMGNQS